MNKISEVFFSLTVLVYFIFYSEKKRGERGKAYEREGSAVTNNHLPEIRARADRRNSICIAEISFFGAGIQ